MELLADAGGAVLYLTLLSFYLDWYYPIAGSSSVSLSSGYDPIAASSGSGYEPVVESSSILSSIGMVLRVWGVSITCVLGPVFFVAYLASDARGDEHVLDRESNAPARGPCGTRMRESARFWCSASWAARRKRCRCFRGGISTGMTATHTPLGSSG